MNETSSVGFPLDHQGPPSVSSASLQQIFEKTCDQQSAFLLFTLYISTEIGISTFSFCVLCNVNFL